MIFELKPRISKSEKDFFLKLGNNWVEEKNKIFNQILKEYDYTCGGCNYTVRNQENASKILQPHLIEENEEDISQSIFIPLCKACHTTQHIDKAIEQDLVKVVNSIFSQKNLIEMCRVGTISQYVQNEDIKELKMTPMEYLDRLKKETLPLHSRVKVIFSNNFDWSDM